MRCIIIAAGMGSRLEHYTDERPKCMVEVGGRSILDHQLEALRANGVEDLHIVRGYLAERLVVEGATYWANEAYRENNILHSLFRAKQAMDGAFLSTYSDIVYEAGVVERLLASEGDIVLVVDRGWSRAYVGREDHPVEQAELVEVDEATGNVKRVGKWVGPQDAVGEFIGLAKYSEQGARWMREVWEELCEQYGLEDRFHHAEKFRKAYLADMFTELIERGHAVKIVVIDGGWREIDTVQDLERVNREGYASRGDA